MPKKLTHQEYVKFMATQRVSAERLEKAMQWVVVKADSLNQHKGICYLYEKHLDSWTRVASFPVVIGKNGFRGGRGLHKRDFDSYKQEGDAAAPAGVFEFGTGFGLGSPGGTWPYRVLTNKDRFVDDANSIFYNQWTQEDQSKKDWNSAETMLRSDGLYNQGLVVRHNMDPVKPGAGSAIFFHIWRHSNHPTLGCTAMTEANMERLLQWLNPNAFPLLLQL